MNTISFLKTILCFVLAVAVLATLIASGGCGSTTSYGKNLTLISMEHETWQKKWHWKDLNTGLCYYSTSAEGGTLWEEPCRQ